MTTSGSHPTLATAFAPAERNDLETLRAQRRAFVSDPLAAGMLEAMPGPAVVLNACRQIVAANGRFLEITGAAEVAAVLARRPGETVGCVHADERPGGCGTTESCTACGAVQAILEAWASHGTAREECRVCTRGRPDGGALDLRVTTSFLRVGGADFVVLALEDISAEKRRRVLERVFFHDVLNLCGGVHGLAEMLLLEGLSADTERTFKQDVHRLSGMVIDEITGHRQMLAAETGELALDLQDVPARELLEEVVALYRHHSVAERRVLEVAAGEPVVLRSDPALLRRVLGNLVKNGLEAVPPGATVTVAVRQTSRDACFTVHNPGALPAEVRLQLFQRSFSTKQRRGRGIGTYSVKLLAERYLGGRVGFRSDEDAGTVFTVALPLAGPIPPPAHGA